MGHGRPTRAPARRQAGKERPIPESTEQPRWEEQPDGTRFRYANGIRIVDRSRRRLPEPPPSPVEHLVTWQEDGGRVIVLGLDASCRPHTITTMYSYL